MLRPPEPRSTTERASPPPARLAHPIAGGSPMLKVKLFSLCSLVASLATVSGFCKTW